VSCTVTKCSLFYPLQADKKGASQTVVGMIFGTFELVIFISSPIFGNYVSIFCWSYSISNLIFI